MKEANVSSRNFAMAKCEDCGNQLPVGKNTGFVTRKRHGRKYFCLLCGLRLQDSSNRELSIAIVLPVEREKPPADGYADRILRHG